ncbi:AAA family ATPase [Nitrospira sp. BLG_2]|uniref:AAA family ATPase n=1 Tax=Nitrospira sp. BLG_2 TaxID=3397507 RepID=UPI003B9B54A7
MSIMVVMQGASGSGKSTMAETIKAMLEATGHKVEICSTDDEFKVDGVYKFDPSKIGENHIKCQKKARYHLDWGTSVIIDNTNTQAWEARPYVQMAQELGVPVFFVPCHGKFNNVHGVPPEKVEAMRNRCEPLSVKACLEAKAPWEK